MDQYIFVRHSGLSDGRDGEGADGSQSIIDCDANEHHMTWESTDRNERYECLLHLIMENILDILNVGNQPTFVVTLPIITFEIKLQADLEWTADLPRIK